ncbi:hypothetical protein J3998_05500 [Thiomicrorhabdus sp. 6S2-11]|jgi:hypothetical protein|uniref:Uncharacterized protein n=1 Tax=Thiomicrorhabdus marina TaxID=2818442 RepID=A0ABS3Q3X9_9GAMM|nr:hypothetical protein [Thiomicrorhabdus marina]MBO1927026.1 hypothetical protein [Thiomicrorhabdus marina]
MCVLIALLMAVVFYALLGKMDFWVLSERFDSQQVVVAEQWQIVYELWPLWLFAFLGGILFVLLMMKLVPAKEE